MVRPVAIKADKKDSFHRLLNDFVRKQGELTVFLHPSVEQFCTTGERGMGRVRRGVYLGATTKRFFAGKRQNRPLVCRGYYSIGAIDAAIIEMRIPSGFFIDGIPL